MDARALRQCCARGSMQVSRSTSSSKLVCITTCCRSQAFLATESAASVAEREPALHYFRGGEGVQGSQLSVAVEHRLVEACISFADTAGRRAAGEVRDLSSAAHPEEER